MKQLGKQTWLMTMLLWLRPALAAPVPVRFVEGVTHGFLVLRTVEGDLIASGDLLQIGRRGQVESRMVFHFKDGSLFDERVMFTQQRVFTMQSYRLVRRGPAFTEESEVSLERASGKYRVNTTPHKDAQEKVLNGTLELPPDVFILNVVLTSTANGARGFQPAARTRKSALTLPLTLLCKLNHYHPLTLFDYLSNWGSVTSFSFDGLLGSMRADEEKYSSSEEDSLKNMQPAALRCYSLGVLAFFMNRKVLPKSENFALGSTQNN